MANEIIEQVKEFFEKNLMVILSVATVLILIVLSITAYAFYKKSVDKKAYISEYKALRLYKISDKKNWPVVENNFITIVKKYPDTKGAKITQLYMGNLYFKTAQYEKAIRAYEELLKKTDKESVIYDLALLGIGYSYENLANFKKAVHYFGMVINNAKSSHMAEAYIEAGRCYEEMKDYKSAMKKYVLLSQKFPENPWKNDVINKINELKLAAQ